MKVLIYDQNFQQQLDALRRNTRDGFQLGAVIGLPGSKQSVLLHFAPCPPLEDTHDKIDSWMYQHAKQVSRMLPGGTDILGIFALCTLKVFEEKKPTVRQALIRVHEALHETVQMRAYDQRCLIHIDSTTSRMTSRLIDTANMCGNGLPQDIKLVKNCTNVTIIKARTTIPLDGHLPLEIVSRNLLQQIDTCLETYENAISNAEILIEDRRVDGGSTLLNSITSDESIQVKFLVRQEASSHESSVPMVSCGAQISLGGGSQLLAVAPLRASCEDVIRSIKQDALRSLKSRCAMHCEDLLVIEDEQRDMSVLHEFPKRVFLNSVRAPSNIPFCDFVFHGDNPKDCLQAFKEILGIDACAEDIQEPVEELPAGESRDTRDAAEVEEYVEEMFTEGAKQLRSNPIDLLRFALACCVPLLAILIGLILSR